MSEGVPAPLCWTCDRPLDPGAAFRCTACGRPFDPRVPQTFNTSGKPLGWGGRLSLRAPAWPFLLVTLTLALGAFWEYHSPTVAMVGWNYYSDFWLGVMLLGAIAFARAVQLAHRNSCERSLGVSPGVFRSRRRFWPWWLALAVGTAIALETRLPLRLGFAWSRTALDRVADAALADPEQAHILAGRWAGLYHIAGVEILGNTVVLYLGRDRGSYGFARMPEARADIIHIRDHAEDDPQQHADFPKQDSPVRREGRRLTGNWFVMYDWYWLVKVGWS